MGFAREYFRQLEARGANQTSLPESEEAKALKKQRERESEIIQKKADELWQGIVAKGGKEEDVLRRGEKKIKDLRALADQLKKDQKCRVKGLEGLTAGDLSDLSYCLEGKLSII